MTQNTSTIKSAQSCCLSIEIPSKKVTGHVVIALCITLLVSGIFLLLAAYNILPPGINAISNLGMWGYILGYAILIVGSLVSAYNIWKALSQKNLHNSVINVEPKENLPSIADATLLESLQNIPDETDLKLKVTDQKADLLDTSLEEEDYILGLIEFYTSKQQNMGTRSYNFCSDLLFHSSEGAALFTEKGIVSSKEKIDFVYTPLLELHKENFDISIIENILNKYVNCIHSHFIPKLFISTAAEPALGIPHALLLVIEPDRLDFSKAHITLIDSFGTSSGYKAFKTKLEQAARTIFSSPSTTFFNNPVLQQQDLACGWHMLANIELLSKQGQVWEFVQNNGLPKRNVREYEQSFYENYVLSAAELSNHALQPKQRKDHLINLVKKGRLSINKNHLPWCREFVNKGVHLPEWSKRI